jgi:drug/metabolite transporter (DMT)-like permease
MESTVRPAAWKILLAFGIIYFVWGSTFLFIRIGVREVPPFLLAGMRFLAAGVILYGWMRFQGVKSPSLREWVGASFLGCIIFLFDYGALFWAEQRVPSGVAAVVLASIPVFIALFDILFLRTQRLTVRLAAALGIGVAGVAVLMNNSASLGEAPVDRLGVLALLMAAVSWSVATILTRKVPLPSSKAMSAATQMLSGGVQLLVLAALIGETKGFHVGAVSIQVWIALAYLIAAGSIAGFTAYVWLLHYESPTKVGTYAYVNPVVAVLVGYFFGGESLGLRTVLGTALVLTSVLTIALGKTKKNLASAGADREPTESFREADIEQAS